MTLNIDISLNTVVINGNQISSARPLPYYEAIIGDPNRNVSPGPPAPVGHRNNVLHFYDDIGLYLHEHHSRRTIGAIVIIFHPEHVMFPTERPFTGSLRICGAEVRPEMRFEEFASQTRAQFQPHLGHAWYLDPNLFIDHVAVGGGTGG